MILRIMRTVTVRDNTLNTNLLALNGQEENSSGGENNDPKNIKENQTNMSHQHGATTHEILLPLKMSWKNTTIQRASGTQRA